MEKAPEVQEQDVIKLQLNQDVKMLMDVFESGAYSINIEGADEKTLLIAMAFVRDAISQFYSRVLVEKSLLKKHEKHWMTNTLFNKHAHCIEVINIHIAETLRSIIDEQEKPILSSNNNLTDETTTDGHEIQSPEPDRSEG